MSSLQEFLSMGGYAAYVWPAYGLAALVLLVNAVQPVLRLKAKRALLRRRGKGA